MVAFAALRWVAQNVYFNNVPMIERTNVDTRFDISQLYYKYFDSLTKS